MRGKSGVVCRWAGLLALLLFALQLRAADSDANAEEAGHRVPVTVVKAAVATLEVWEPAVGELEAVDAPGIAAEVGGRVVAVAVDVGDRVTRGTVLAEIDPEDYRLARELARADIRRLEALIRSQELQVERLRSLLRQKSVNRSALDEAEARLGALQAQRQAARVRLQQAERNLRKARVRSPIDGRVDARRVSVGDYVKVGMPLFHLTSPDRLRARLPYPESLAGRLRAGLPVRLQTPTAPEKPVEAEVTDLRPMITPENRAIEVIVAFDNPGGWEAGASVTGQVRIERREQAVVVPEICVVARPAGRVVYVIENGVARQRKVRTGLRHRGMVEIRAGLEPGELVARDGAGFLTDGVPVEVADR